MVNQARIEWSAEQVTRVVTSLVRKRHDTDLQSYIEKLKRCDDSIDRCRDSDIIGLLALIGVKPEHVAA